MSSAVQDLLPILDLEQLEVNLFRGRSPQVGWQRVFGGQVIGQALVAACRTVDVAARPPHSLHAYFLLAGDPKVPIIYEVDRIRDGKSFTTRRVVAIQHGEAIFIMSVSFHGDEPGMTTRPRCRMCRRPKNCRREADLKQRVLPRCPSRCGGYYERERPIELRPVEFDRYHRARRSRTAASTSGSVRRGRLPDDRPSTNAFSPTPPTWGCSTPR